MSGERTARNGPTHPETVAIVGATGALGFGLALRLAHVGGVTIVIGSRRPEAAEEAAERALAKLGGAGDVRGLENHDAVRIAGVVVMSVPLAGHAQMLKGLRDHIRPGSLVIDATVPLAPAVGGKPTRTISLWQGSVAQQSREILPDTIEVVSALHTVGAANLADLARPLDEDVLVCGDRRRAKERAAALIERIPGLRSVDCGALEMSRVTEQLTPLLIGINRRYRAHAGIRIAGLDAGARTDPG